MQPGSVITPGDSENEEQAPPAQQPATAASSPELTPTQPESIPAPQPITAPTPTNNQANEENSDHSPEPYASSAISWSASEYVAHHKTSGWYMGLGVVAGLAAALVFLVTRDIVTLGSIIIVAVLFGVFASRKPSVLQYELDESGITIANKHYPYDEFKSFSVYDEGGLRSIFLMPLKRFMPGLSVYYPPDMEDSVLDTMSLYLPHEDRQPDAVDRLMKRVRF